LDAGRTGVMIDRHDRQIADFRTANTRPCAKIINESPVRVYSP